MLSHFSRILECDGQTDRQADGRTDGTAVSISHVSVLTRDTD